MEDLTTALLWTHNDEPHRRDNFPSWSWVGWEGAVTGAYHISVRGTINRSRDIRKRYLSPLHVWKAGDDGHPELVCDFNPIHEDETKEEDKGGEDAMDTDEEESTPPQSDGVHSPQEDSDSWEDVSDTDDGTISL